MYRLWRFDCRQPTQYHAAVPLDVPHVRCIAEVSNYQDCYVDTVGKTAPMHRRIPLKYIALLCKQTPDLLQWNLSRRPRAWCTPAVRLLL